MAAPPAILTRGQSDRPTSERRTERLAVWRLPLIGFALAVSGCAFALFIDRRVETVVQSQLTAVLQVTADTAVAGALPVLDAAARAAVAAAADPQLVAAAQAELACTGADRPCSPRLAEAARPYVARGGFAGVVLGDRGGRARPSSLGSASSLAAPLSAAAAQLATGTLGVTAARVQGRALLFMGVLVPQGLLLF